MILIFVLSTEMNTFPFHSLGFVLKSQESTHFQQCLKIYFTERERIKKADDGSNSIDMEQKVLLSYRQCLLERAGWD